MVFDDVCECGLPERDHGLRCLDADDEDWEDQ